MFKNFAKMFTDMGHFVSFFIREVAKYDSYYNDRTTFNKDGMRINFVAYQS